MTALAGQIGYADSVRNPVGEVLSMSGLANSVVVLRGAEAYTLAVGDTLFEGDRVFTRIGASASLRIDRCKIDLEPAAFLTVDDTACSVGPLALDASSNIKGIPVGEVSEGVGATPALLPLLLAGAGAAGAAAGIGAFASGDGDEPVP